ncbi:MAG: Hsp20/alpha crystallin family protein [Pseudomonadota bacterium]
MKPETLKESVTTFWDKLADGWRHLLQSASGALTRFKPDEKTELPAPSAIDDAYYLPSQAWAMIGGDVFEDDKRLIVRLELPGMDKRDLNIEVRGDSLLVSGEKRFERESSEGRWRVMQCAYGAFQRSVPLPAKVLADKASARYHNGVLRVELPKARPSERRTITVNVT